MTSTELTSTKLKTLVDRLTAAGAPECEDLIFAQNHRHDMFAGKLSVCTAIATAHYSAWWLGSVPGNTIIQTATYTYANGGKHSKGPTILHAIANAAERGTK